MARTRQLSRPFTYIPHTSSEECPRRHLLCIKVEEARGWKAYPPGV